MTHDINDNESFENQDFIERDMISEFGEEDEDKENFDISSEEDSTDELFFGDDDFY